MTTPSVERIAQIEGAREVCLDEDRAYAQTYSAGHPTRTALREGYKACHLALTLLSTLSQSLTEAQGEIARLTKEHEDLLARSGKPDVDRDFSIHASTDGGS